MATEPVRIPYRYVVDRLSPMIFVKLHFADAQAVEWAYVDSGAWYSIFRGGVARQLGIMLETGKPIWTKGVSGQQIPVYLHRIDMDVAGVRLSANVCFSDQLGIGFNILGRDSIFNVLQFCFNDRDGELRISRL
ncbi:MAG: hypothetical protein HZB51_31270 [Chloroflexi bacterium]|nr:hypothetical protein [Chloroflexota bacterium]